MCARTRSYPAAWALAGVVDAWGLMLTPPPLMQRYASTWARLLAAGGVPRVGDDDTGRSKAAGAWMASVLVLEGEDQGVRRVGAGQVGVGMWPGYCIDIVRM